MTGKHYGWPRRWIVDLATCTAIHESGLIVRFVESQDSPGAWDGTPINAQEWLTSIKNTMPRHDLERHAARLMREAGDAYRYQLKRRH